MCFLKFAKKKSEAMNVKKKKDPKNSNNEKELFPNQPCLER
jgi:hypothetical protein